MDHEVQSAGKKTARWWPLAAIVVSVVAGSIAWLVAAHVSASGGKHMGDETFAISGKWLVQTIEIGSHERIAIPAYLTVSLTINDVERTIEARGAGAAYDCRYSRVSNELRLSSCLASSNVPVRPDTLVVRISQAIEHAFSGTQMSLVPHGRDEVTIRMRDVSFAASRAH